MLGTAPDGRLTTEDHLHTKPCELWEQYLEAGEPEPQRLTKTPMRSGMEGAIAIGSEAVERAESAQQRGWEVPPWVPRTPPRRVFRPPPPEIYEADDE